MMGTATGGTCLTSSHVCKLCFCCWGDLHGPAAASTQCFSEAGLKQQPWFAAAVAFLCPSATVVSVLVLLVQRCPLTCDLHTTSHALTRSLCCLCTMQICPQANYNMDSDAASEAASSAAKSLDEKSSVASETPLIPERKWINTHAWIQGLTMVLLVRCSYCWGKYSLPSMKMVCDSRQYRS